MKKTISLIIAAAMLLALGVTAFAAEEQEPVVRVAIPVEVTVNQTGNVAPERHTFYYDLHYDYAVAFDSSDSSSQQSLKVSFGGALKGDENGFSVTVDGKGTASGTIIFEGTESVLNSMLGAISKRAQTAPDGWTYDETEYKFSVFKEYGESGQYSLSYYMIRMDDRAASGYDYLGTVPATYVNEYKEDRIANRDSDPIKITSQPEENPSTGAPIYGLVAAVIAIGAAAVALKVRK